MERNLSVAYSFSANKLKQVTFKFRVLLFGSEKIADNTLQQTACFVGRNLSHGAEFEVRAKRLKFGKASLLERQAVRANLGAKQNNHLFCSSCGASCIVSPQNK